MSSSREGIPSECATMEVDNSKPQTNSQVDVRILATPQIENTTTSTDVLLSSPTDVGYEATRNNQSSIDDDCLNDFPPGYRFCPTDEELVTHYLRKKVEKRVMPLNRIMDVNLYRHNPQDLAEKNRKYGEREWYFFTPRDRKYKNGTRPNRAAGDGYWKATGADKHIKSKGFTIGFRKALVFYKGKPPKGEKTNWIMHEYRVPDSHLCNSRKGTNDMQLDEWVLCRIYEKVEKSTRNRNREEDPSPPILQQHDEASEEFGMELDYTNMRPNHSNEVNGNIHQSTLPINGGGVNGGLPQFSQFNINGHFNNNNNNIQAMSVDYDTIYPKIVEPIFVFPPTLSTSESLIWGDAKPRSGILEDFWNIHSLDNVDLGVPLDFNNLNPLETFAKQEPLLPTNINAPTNNNTK